MDQRIQLRHGGVVDLNLGLAPHVPDKAGDKRAHGLPQKSHADPSVQIVGGDLDVPHGLVVCLHHPADLIHRQLAHRRQRHLVGVPDKQLGPQVPLQIIDVPAEHGLCQEQKIGGFAVVQAVRQNHKFLQPVDVHPISPCPQGARPAVFSVAVVYGYYTTIHYAISI